MCLKTTGSFFKATSKSPPSPEGRSSSPEVWLWQTRVILGWCIGELHRSHIWLRKRGAGHLTWHSCSSSSPVCCAWHSSHWGQGSLPGPIKQHHFSSPSKPPPFLLGPKVESLPHAAHLPYNYTIIYLQAKVMTGVQEPDHTKRDKLVKIHPDSSSHSYSGSISETSIPKDIWINL